MEIAIVRILLCAVFGFVLGFSDAQKHEKVMLLGLWLILLWLPK